MTKAIKFKKWNCLIEKGKYNNGRIALSFVNKRNGEDIIVATVNIPEVRIAKDEVIIKNYSENEGVLEILMQAGIISEPVRSIETVFVTFPICKLL